MNGNVAFLPTANLPPLDLDIPIHEPSVAGGLTDARLSEYVADLAARDSRSVRFALACLGVYGGLKHCTAVAKLLHHTDPQVVRDAENTLWRIWLRGDAPDAARDLASAIGDIRSERYQAAAEKLDRLALNSPTVAEVHFQRGLAQHFLGRPLEAGNSFRRAMQLNQHHFAAAVAYAALLVEQEDWARAAMFYERALRIHPRLSGVGEALDCLRRRLALGPAKSA